MRRTRGGFALMEAVAVGVVAALLAVMLLVAGSESRRLARLGEDITKLRQFGSATCSYAADHSDLYWTFSWKKGATLSQWPDLNVASIDLKAAANQAVDILRRLADRTDIPPMSSWWPYGNHSHLVLTEYLRAEFTDLSAVSSADERQLTWARNPRGFDAGLYPPWPTGGAPWNADRKRWPYRSSFMLEPAYFDWSPVGGRVTQGASHAYWNVPGGAQFSGHQVSETVFPAQKVHLRDTHARHFGPRVAYCTHDEARLPLLFVDGAVSVRAAKDSNPGWQPNSPTQPTPTVFNYQPDVWEAPTLSGAPSEPVIGRFRWTRGTATQNGLAGRDFGGPETCSGQPGCP